jgi:hypothetical protein
MMRLDLKNHWKKSGLKKGVSPADSIIVIEPAKGGIFSAIVFFCIPRQPTLWAFWGTSYNVP